MYQSFKFGHQSSSQCYYQLFKKNFNHQPKNKKNKRVRQPEVLIIFEWQPCHSYAEGFGFHQNYNTIEM